MTKYDLKPAVHQSRKAGQSIGEISKRFGLSKSTVSAWCFDVTLTPAQQEKLNRRVFKAGLRGRQLGADMNRKKKLDAISEAKKWASQKIRILKSVELLVAGIALYWAEGSKSDGTTGFVFVNSDPDMILFMKKWLLIVMGVSKEDLMPRLSINIIHKDRVTEVFNFWSNLLGLPVERFGTPFFAKSVQKKTYKNHDTYYGVLRLKVGRSTNLKYRVLALIQELKQQSLHLSG